MRVHRLLFLTVVFVLCLCTGSGGWSQAAMSATAMSGASDSPSDLTVDLAENHVDITTGFTGSRVVLFGVKDAPGDIAITISGPVRKMVVRRKEQVLGLWMNRGAVQFLSVPVYYDYALSRPEAALASAEELHRNAIGLNALDFEPVWEDDPAESARFKEGLIRTRQALGLYPLEPKPVEFLDDHLFRTTLTLPANVPTGEYTIRTFLVQDGKVALARTTALTVEQVGFSAEVFNFAWAHGFFYGILAVGFAALAGWAANTFLRRD